MTGAEFLRRITRARSGARHCRPFRPAPRQGEPRDAALREPQDDAKGSAQGNRHRPVARHARPARAEPARSRRIKDATMIAYSYPATLDPDADGRLVVHFPALPEALTDGADEAEALREAADCLSEALASRIVDGEEIPTPGPLVSGQYLVSPSPTIALKAALYEALRRREMTVADLAARRDMDCHQAARLIDPPRPS